MATAERTPDGIDVVAVTRWLAARVDALTEPLRFTPIEGGRSNLTFLVHDADQRTWVLRRPPLHGVLESAHDMGREHRIISALADSDVPVPRVVGLETDPDVSGAPFYVMHYVEGPIARDRASAEALDLAARGAAADALVDTLAILHQVDPAQVGLGDLGRHDGYIERQLRRWQGQYVKGRAREVPLIDAVHDRLVANVPAPQGVAIVHGDYRLDNVILSPTGQVRAVLDWELCTLGDPLADVGLLSVYWEDVKIPLIDPPHAVAGFPDKSVLMARYAATSGRDLCELDYYVAFGFWKLAVILEGVYSRYLAGGYGDKAAPMFEPVGEVVFELAERASDAAAKAGR
ncbi:MAG: aminoglycoside phosphotransferase (APT) family kinase protein [Glaciecola sp.]